MKREEIIEILKFAPLSELQEEADKVRKLYCGEDVYIRGIIEFSNYCHNDCLYCGLRKSNKYARRYRMSKQEIVDLAREIIDLGVGTIVLQSGDDFYYTTPDICSIIEEIKAYKDSVAVTLSIGERPLSDYYAFKQVGADRYLIKHETANPELYAKLHPGQSFERRIAILKYLKEIGYEIGPGNIVGLPGQTIEDLADDILLLGELGADMAGIGPFIPQKDTPLAKHKSPDLELVLRVLAVTRIVMNKINLPATTAVATLDPENGQVLALKFGANVLMPDFSPGKYRGDYRIYDNKKRVTLSEAEKVISAANRKILLEKVVL